MNILNLVIENDIAEPARRQLALQALKICDHHLKGDDRDNAIAGIMDLVERAKSKQDIDSRANAARLVG